MFAIVFEIPIQSMKKNRFKETLGVNGSFYFSFDTTIITIIARVS